MSHSLQFAVSPLIHLLLLLPLQRVFLKCSRFFFRRWGCRRLRD